jgi:hypothetical protein
VVGYVKYVYQPDIFHKVVLVPLLWFSVK